MSRSLGAFAWVSAILLMVFVMALSWASVAHAATPFDAQYGNPGSPSVEGASTVAGQVSSAIQGMLPSTGGPMLPLGVLGVLALCFGLALLARRIGRSAHR